MAWKNNVKLRYAKARNVYQHESQSLIEITLNHMREGFEPFLIQIMFKALNGKKRAVLDQMKQHIEGTFYSRFCTRVVRNPNSIRGAQSLPRLYMLPDVPVAKSKKTSGTTDINYGGLHYIGVLLVPVTSRLKERADLHIIGNPELYCRGEIYKVYIERVTHDLRVVADYCVKGIKRDPELEEWRVVAPAPRRIESKIEPCSIRDLESTTNQSWEVCRALIESKQSTGARQRCITGRKVRK